MGATLAVPIRLLARCVGRAMPAAGVNTVTLEMTRSASKLKSSSHRATSQFPIFFRRKPSACSSGTHPALRHRRKSSRK
eukprot:scaffold2684_cov124-Isochrysis_galbana.AAC.1